MLGLERLSSLLRYKMYYLWYYVPSSKLVLAEERVTCIIWRVLHQRFHCLLSFFQLEITALSYGKGPRISAGMGDVTDTNLPPPTEEDQEKMRKFWAMEEANAPRGWEDEQELDYAEISQRTADQSQNSGPPSE